MKSEHFKTFVIIAFVGIVVMYYLNVIHPKQLSTMTVPVPQSAWDGQMTAPPQPSQGQAPMTDPSQLLPKDSNSEWSQMNPRGSGQLQGINLLSAGALIGINTVGSTLRNPNLQLRSEPANPQSYNGPWQNSTIQPDLMRTPLELGQGPA